MVQRLENKRKLTSAETDLTTHKRTCMDTIFWHGRRIAVSTFSSIGPFLDINSICSFELACKKFREIAHDQIWEAWTVTQKCSRAGVGSSAKSNYLYEAVLKRHLMESSPHSNLMGKTNLYWSLSTPPNKVSQKQERFRKIPQSKNQIAYFKWINTDLSDQFSLSKTPSFVKDSSQDFILSALIYLRRGMELKQTQDLELAKKDLEEAFSQNAFLAAYIPLYFNNACIEELSKSMVLKAAKVGYYDPLYCFLQMQWRTKKYTEDDFDTLVEIFPYPPTLFMIATHTQDPQQRQFFLESAIESYRIKEFEDAPTDLLRLAFIHYVKMNQDHYASKALHLLSYKPQFTIEEPHQFFFHLAFYALRSNNHQSVNVLVEKHLSIHFAKEFELSFEISASLFASLINANRAQYNDKLISMLASKHRLWSIERLQEQIIPNKLHGLIDNLSERLNSTHFWQQNNLILNAGSGFHEALLIHALFYRFASHQTELKEYYKYFSYRDGNVDLLLALLAHDLASSEYGRAHARIAGGERQLLAQTPQSGLLSLCIGLTKYHVGLHRDADIFFTAAAETLPDCLFLKIISIKNKTKMGKIEEASQLFNNQNLINQIRLWEYFLREFHSQVEPVNLRLTVQSYKSLKDFFLTSPLTEAEQTTIVDWVNFASQICKGLECQTLLEDQVRHASSIEMRATGYFKLIQQGQEIQISDQLKLAIARHQASKKHHLEAINLYKNLLHQIEQQPTINHQLIIVLQDIAYCYDSMQQWETASAYYQRILAIWDGAPSLQINTLNNYFIYKMAHNLFQQRDYVRAEAIFENVCLTNAPVTLLQFAANIKLMLGKFEEAKALTSQAQQQILTKNDLN